jgi:hypothetical protein
MMLNQSHHSNESDRAFSFTGDQGYSGLGRQQTIQPRGMYSNLNQQDPNQTYQYQADQSSQSIAPLGHQHQGAFEGHNQYQSVQTFR